MDACGPHACPLIYDVNLHAILFHLYRALLKLPSTSRVHATSIGMPHACARWYVIAWPAPTLPPPVAFREGCCRGRHIYCLGTAFQRLDEGDFGRIRFSCEECTAAAAREGERLQHFLLWHITRKPLAQPLLLFRPSCSLFSHTNGQSYQCMPCQQHCSYAPPPALPLCMCSPQAASVLHPWPDHAPACHLIMHLHATCAAEERDLEEAQKLQIRVPSVTTYTSQHHQPVDGGCPCCLPACLPKSSACTAAWCIMHHGACRADCAASSRGSQILYANGGLRLAPHMLAPHVLAPQAVPVCI